MPLANGDIRAEAAYSLSAETCRFLAENAPCVLMLYDPQLTVVYLSPQAEQITGIPTTDFIGRTNREAGMSEDLCNLWETALKKVFSTGCRQTLEFDLPSPQNPRSFILNLVPEFDPDGHAVCHVLGACTETTERKRAERALRQANDLFENVLGQLDDSFGVFDAQWRFVFLNEAAARRLGRPRNQLLGRDVRELIPHSAAAPVLAHLQAVANDRRPREWTDRSPVTERWLQWHAFPWKQGVAVVARDVSERKKVEEELDAAHRQVQSIIDNTTSIIYAFDLGERFLLANTALAELLNSTPEQMIGKRRHEFMPMEDADWHEANDRQVIEAGRALVFEERSQLKDRSIAWLTTKFPLRDAQGKIYAVGGISTDVTERKRVEEALEKMRFMLSEGQKIANLGSFEYIAETGATVWSDEECRIFGIPPGTPSPAYEVMLSRFIHPEDAAQLHETFTAAKDSGSVFELEHRIVRPDGSVRVVYDRAHPYFDEKGKLVRYVGATLDVTERKAAEEELRKFTVGLERQVAERTAVEKERSMQLRSLAIELIETEERERRQFAYLLHDDLQQMLAAAKMQVEAAAEKPSADPMLSNIVDLLCDSIAKTRRLSHQLSPAILHQAGLIATLEWLVRQMKEQFGLQAELELNADLLMERTPQKVFLFRAVQELLFNIVKHAGVKSARVEVTSSEDSITVRVSDHGSGFDPEIVHKRTVRLGFGLLTIKERASYIGGTFAIESAPGQGSRFTLTVPSAAVDEDEETTTGAWVAVDHRPSHSRSLKSVAGGTRVLFVDDHEVMRQGLMKLVKGQPSLHVAGEASNGREALEKARRLKPDVIVMDISMPVMDGLEATRRIKAELPHVRIIGLTMHDDPQLTASMQQAGAEATLSKTTSAAELIKAIYADRQV